MGSPKWGPTQREPMSLEAEASALHERVLGVFVDAEPLTAAEVAVAAAVDPEDAAAALEALVADDELHHATVRGVDIRHRKRAEDDDAVDLEEPIDLYHRPAAALAEGVGSVDGAAVDDADELGRRLARMDVEGASEMMRSWRRDAVRAAYDHLDDAGPTATAALVEAVYPAHQAGFDDADAWWDCVRPRLLRLPGVTVEDVEDERRWRIRNTDDDR